MPSKSVATYQGRPVLSPEQEAFLAAYSGHYNHVERKLYAEMQRDGKPAASFKNDYLIRFDMTARQFNAIGRNLEGKIASIKESTTQVSFVHAFLSSHKAVGLA